MGTKVGTAKYHKATIHGMTGHHYVFCLHGRWHVYEVAKGQKGCASSRRIDRTEILSLEEIDSRPTPEQILQLSGYRQPSAA